MRKEKKSLWDIIRSPPAHTDTRSQQRKRQRTDEGSTGTAPTCSTPDAPRATQHDVPDPRSGGASA